MNKYITSILIIVLISTNAVAGNLKAYFTYCTFNSPDNGPYIETYLSVIGNSSKFIKNDDNAFQSTIEVTLIFKQGEEIKKYKKYNLLSPEITDSLSARSNFMDQQRISLPNGKYEFEISIRDINATGAPFKSTQILNIDYPKDSISISDIEFVESLTKTTVNSIITKSGYDILPYTSDFYPESIDKIAFYSEIYNSDKILGKNENFLITYYIETLESQKITINYKSFSRETAKPVNILLKSFTIDKLPSGNYNLVIEARNKTNELLSIKKVFFQRSNPKSTPLLIHDDYLISFVNKIELNDLKEYINSLEPISSNIEISFAQNQLKGGDEILMKQYFYNFWITRNQLDPETEWNNYNKQVKFVNKLFSSSITKGYNTDRGIVYLKYGKPNTRTAFPIEPLSLPYEIWHYYQIGEFRNKKFVFYDPDEASNSFPLLHSDMPGFTNNPQWKIYLKAKNQQFNNPDDKNTKGYFGEHTDDNFNNPR